MKGTWALAMLLLGLAACQAPPPVRAPEWPTTGPRPIFQPSKEPLSVFARKAEAHCGFAPGAALVMPSANTIRVRLAEPARVPYPQVMCLLDALDWPNLEKKGVRFLIVGETQDDPASRLSNKKGGASN